MGLPGHASPTSADPETVLNELLDGNKRFRNQEAEHPHQDSVRRSELTRAQKPQAVVLTCSDSRVPPEIIFDQGLGDLFVVRTAGNVADAVAIASIEYAVAHLGVRLILVLGHESCGAVAATLATPAGGDAGSPHLNALVAEIQRNLGPGKPVVGDALLTSPAKTNAEGVAAALQIRSKIISRAVADRQLKIMRGMYHLSNGTVDVW